MTVHKFSTQYNTEQCSDNLPSYLQTTIIAQMLSIGGERAHEAENSSVLRYLPKVPAERPEIFGLVVPQTWASHTKRSLALLLQRGTVRDNVRMSVVSRRPSRVGHELAFVNDVIRCLP